MKVLKECKDHGFPLFVGKSAPGPLFSKDHKPLPQLFDISLVGGREDEIKKYLDSVTEACTQRK